MTGLGMDSMTTAKPDTGTPHSRSDNHHYEHQPRDPGGEGGGQWVKADMDLPGLPDLDDGDDGDGETEPAASLIASRRTTSHHFAAFDDPHGKLLKNPGRGVAIRDDNNYGGFKHDDDLEEAFHIAQSDVESLARAVEEMAGVPGPVTTEGDEPVLVKSVRAGDLYVGVFDDPGDTWGAAEPRFIAVVDPARDQGVPDWDGVPNDESLLLVPDEAAGFARVLRETAAASPRPKQGLDRKTDKLRLDGRIGLADGETLAGSANLGYFGGEREVLAASTRTPDGPALRLAIHSGGEFGDDDARDWDASNDGDTIVLDTAAIAALQAAIADLTADARADRARLKPIFDATAAKVEALEASKEDVYDRDLVFTDEQRAARADLTRQLDSLVAGSPVMQELRTLQTRRNELLQMTFGEQTAVGWEYIPLPPELQPELDGLKERIAVLAVHPDVDKSDDLSNAIRAIERDARQADLDAIDAQIRQLWNADPGVDDLIARRVVRGTAWGDLVLEAHGSDSRWEEDEGGGRDAWRVDMAIAPPGSGPDWTIYHDREDSVEAVFDPAELKAFLTGLAKVTKLAGVTAGASRSAGNAFARGADRDVSAWNASNPRNPKDADGKWTETPGGAARVSKKIGDWFRSEKYQKISTGGHITLDIVGLAPGLGEPFDLVNAAWYLAERKPKKALLSLGSAVPGLGYVTSVAKALKHIRTARRFIKVKQAAKAATAVAAKSPVRSAGQAERTAFGVALDGKHDRELLAQLRDRWGTDPRPWAVLHAHLTQQAGQETADEMTAELFVAANGQDALDTGGKRSSAALIAVSIVDAVVGLAYTPQQWQARQQFLRAQPANAREAEHWKHQLRDPGGEGGGQWVSGPGDGMAGYAARVARLAAAYEAGIKERELLAGGRMADTYRVTFNTGDHGILKTAKLNREFPMLKPELQTHNEVLAPKVGAAFGISTMPAAIRVSPDTVLKEYGEGEPVPEFDSEEFAQMLREHTEELRRIALFDVATQNGDRHRLNLLMAGQGARGTFAPIDHGNLFGPVTRDEYREVIPLPEYANPVMTNPFTRTGKVDRNGRPELEYRAGGIPVAELEADLERLKTLKADFEAADLVHQYRAMVQRLDTMLADARYQATKQQGRSNDRVSGHPAGLGHRPGHGYLRSPGLAVQQPDGGIDGDAEAGPGLEQRAGARLLRRLDQRRGEDGRHLARGPRIVGLKAPKAPRVGVGVAVKKDSDGDWRDRYGQYADLPNAPRLPAHTKTPASPAPADADPAARLTGMKIPELKTLLGAAGLSKTGKKAELVDRLAAHEKAKGAHGNESLRPDGKGTLGQVPASGVQPGEEPGSVLRPAGGADRRPDSGPAAGSGGDGTAGGDVPATDRPAQLGDADGAGTGAAGDAADGGIRRRAARGDGGADTAATAVTGPVFRPRGQGDLAPSGEMARIDANLEALRTLRRIDAEGRPATEDEQSKLARWSGWGATKKIFEDHPDDPAADRSKWLRRYGMRNHEMRQLLGPKEYDAASRTVRNAHYTDAAYVDAIWNTLGELGFKGGRVLEPGSGSGTFMGYAPDNTHVVGVELDPTTAGISAALYPNHTVLNDSFADALRDWDGKFDAAVGNVPFADTALVDPKHNPGRQHSMHNHFIIKSLHLTRPGGLNAIITSRYTMDSASMASREKMAELADLVGAVRLPSGAHGKAAGTDVVTDLLIFRRREEGAAPRGLSFVDTRTVDVDGAQIQVNEAFAGDPSLVLGTFGLGGMRHGEDLTVTGPKNAEPALRKALAAIAKQAKANGLTMAGGTVDARRVEIAPPQGRQPDGFLRAKPDGTVTVSVGGFEQPHPVAKAQAEELRALLHIRDTEFALLDEESANVADTDRMHALRAELNTAYDEYLAKFGAINRFTAKRSGRTRINDETGEPEDIYSRQYPGQGGFRSDPSSASVRGLEDWDQLRNTTRKAAIFRHRVIAPRTPVTRTDSPKDALNVAMDQHGQDDVNLAAVASLLNVDETRARELLGDLVYDDPDRGGKPVPAAAYLSGNVRQKLDTARLAAAEDPKYSANVAALRAVLPADLKPEDIEARMGASWIGEKYVQQFVREILRDPEATVEHALGAQWKVTPGNSGRKNSAAATSLWGTTGKNGYDIAEVLLTQKSIKVHDRVGDPPKNVLNQAKTEAAQAKKAEMAERFAQWVWEDPARAQELSAAYNNQFNSLVLRNYDAEGARLTLPGKSERFNPHPHVKAAVARIIAEPAVGLWHEVGAGKTAEMVIGSAELKRLGLVNKPAIVVPNHMLEQFTREYLEIYPKARLLAASSADLEKDKRREFIARAATGDWDAVILTQNAFEAIPVSEATETAYLEKEVQKLRAHLEAARAKSVAEQAASGVRKKKDSFAVAQVEKALENAEERIKANKEKAGHDDASLTFEQTGIDYLFVDEAHFYKNLRRMSNIEGQGITGNGKTTDLHTKIEYLRERNPNGRVLTLATATPIANTMGEAHTMMRYLRPDLLREMGIEEFDNFVTNFAVVVSGVEPAPEGGLRTKERIAKFVNVPELLRPWWTAGDVKTAEDLEHITNPPKLRPNPAADGARIAEVEVVPASEQLRVKVAELGGRAKALRKRRGPPKAGADNMLNITNEGRAAALDLRLVGMTTDEPTKLDFAADKIAGIWRETKDNRYPAGTDAGSPLHPEPGALQIVFADLGTPSAKPAAAGVLKGTEIEGTDAREVVATRGGKQTWTIYTGDENTKIGTLEQTPGGKHWKALDGKKKVLLVSASKAGAVQVLLEAAPPPRKNRSQFSVYDELRNKLVEKGMPRDKIRFIHEAKSDSDKARLFADARDGTVAVLIGSTGKMGTGTNVQHRAVALHHLDVPWRPADVQQREGRIIRQKNQNSEVRVIRYVTEGSFDAYNWGVVARKAKFINQMMRGKLETREMEDIGDFAMSADVAAALADGNPTLIQHAEAQSELGVLERRFATYQNNQKNLPQRIKAAKTKLAESRDALTATERAISIRNNAAVQQAGKFAMTVGGVPYSKHTDAADALRLQLGKGVSFYRPTSIGELSGFTVRAERESLGIRIELDGVPGSSFLVTRTDVEKADLITRLNNKLKDLETIRARHTANIDAEQQNIEVAQTQTGERFKDTARLQAARARFAELDEQVKAQAAAADARRDERPGPSPDSLTAEIKGFLDQGQDVSDMDALRDRLEAGDGFRSIGELKTYLDSSDTDAKLLGPNKARFLDVFMAKLSPRGKLLVHKIPDGTGWRVSEPRSMLSLGKVSEAKTLNAAMALAAAIEDSGIPWNAGPENRASLLGWKSPAGANPGELIAAARAAQPDLLDPNGTWAQLAGLDRSSFRKWSDSDLRAMLAQRGLPTDGSHTVLLARLQAAGISVGVPATPAGAVDFAGARALLSAFDRAIVPGQKTHAMSTRLSSNVDAGAGNGASPVLAAFTRRFDVGDHPRWDLGAPGGKGGQFRPNKGGGGGARPMSDAEFEARQKRVAAVISEAFGTHATDRLFKDDTGAWKPQRDALHREIAASMYAQARNVPRQGRAVLSGGLPGAGKTTVLRQHAGIDPGDYFVINPDDVKEELARRGLVPDVPGHPDLSPMERAALVHAESRRITELMADMAYRNKTNVMWDITMGAPEEIDTRVEAMRSHGYTDIAGIFVEIPVETSVQRALGRYRQGADELRAGKGLGGRFVPPEVIMSYLSPTGTTINRDAFETTRHVLDDWSIFDNAVHGRAPMLIGRKEARV